MPVCCGWFGADDDEVGVGAEMTRGEEVMVGGIVEVVRVEEVVVDDDVEVLRGDDVEDVVPGETVPRTQ